jgi:hypothetical protein
MVEKNQHVFLKNLKFKPVFETPVRTHLNPHKTSKVSFCKGRLTPLHQWRRVDIESPNWHNTIESAGSTNFTKYQLSVSTC